MTRLVVRKLFKTVMTAEWRADLSNELCFMFCVLSISFQTLSITTYVLCCL